YQIASGSLRLSLPPTTTTDERDCLYELRMGAHYETFPLLTRPVIRLAVFPEHGVGAGGQVLVRFTLGEQPPDLVNSRLTYVLRDTPAGAELPSHHGPAETIVSLPCRLGEWNEYVLDLAADVQRLGVRGGLDNSLHRLQLGVVSQGEAVAAHFGHLEVSVAHKGSEVLDLHRQLLSSLPVRVQHYVGLEVSYYGRHITGFGSSVPIPDYEALLPNGLTSEQVVEHIHRHGGLASLCHPPRANAEETAAQLAERRIFGVDMMEVAHGFAGLNERLQLWDRLARHGLIVTGTGVSDAHTAKQGWRVTQTRPVAWVTRIWARSLEESDLLEGLRRGHVFFADPSQFQGDVEITGPGGVEMGDVAITPDDEATPELEARVTGVRPGDLVAWLCNGALVRVATADGEQVIDRYRPTVPVDRLLAIRLQVHRPARATAAFDGIIACSNPVYLANTPPETGHRINRIG
ncbi:MAG TPA: hypothetical protein VGW38_27090, partial [Chloroflexota bacterium]|nr:hypothetical protein [Chloroflexota bacterium]